MKVIYEGKTKRIVSAGERMVLLVVDELSGNTMRVYDLAQKRLANQVELASKLDLI